MGNDKNSLAHTTWNCKYHIVFAPKYRRQLLYGELKADIGKILRELCEWKGIKIIEAELCPNHIHGEVKNSAECEHPKSAVYAARPLAA